MRFWRHCTTLSPQGKRHVVRLACLAGFKALLSRYSGQGRHHRRHQRHPPPIFWEALDQSRLSSNTLALRHQAFPATRVFRQIVLRAKETTLGRLRAPRM